MKLMELFDDSGEDIVQELRSEILDSLVALAANGVPYVTVQSVIEKLREKGTGLAPDRALVMSVLDPNEVKLVTKIEGDRIYFTVPQKDARAVDDMEKERDKEKVQSKATAQAKKNVQNNDGPLG